MTQDHPTIPTAHFLRELRKAMDTCLSHTGVLHDLLKQQAKISRPWAFLLQAYENHERNTEWFENWCRNCLPLL